jgi:hypothetical protein
MGHKALVVVRDNHGVVGRQIRQLTQWVTWPVVIHAQQLCPMTLVDVALLRRPRRRWQDRMHLGAKSV